MATLKSSLILSLIDHVTAPARGIAGAVQGLQGRLEANNRQMAAMRGQMIDAAAVGYALFRGLSAPITAAADFEASMNRVGAALSPTNTEMEKLTALAKDMGRTTQFSVNDSALAIEMLAKNGLDAASILGGALATSMDVAAASGADLSTAADITTDIMANFKLRAEDLANAANGISGVLVQSKFDIEDYRLALGQAGGVAGGLGVTLEDFNTTIAATSSYFASGSDAGTSFKTFLQRLVPASTPAAEAMQELNLEFFDANGNMKSMAEISQELRDGLDGLSDEAKNAALQDIFGTDAIRTAIALAEVGSREFENLQAIIANTSAADQARARMEGFWGTVKRLQSAFDLLSTTIGEALLPAMTAVADKLIPIVDQMIAFAQANPRLTAAIVGTTTALVAFRVASLAARFAMTWMGGAYLFSAIAGMKGLGTATTAAAAPFGLLATRMKAARTALIAYAMAASIAGKGAALQIIGQSALAVLNPLRLATAAMHALKVAVIGTGIGAALVGIAAAGMFIFNNWSGIGEMFNAFGTAFMAAIGPLAPMLQPVLDGTGQLLGIFTGLTGELDGAKWTQWGAQAGLAIGGLVATAAANVSRLVEFLQAIPSKLMALPGQIAGIFTSIDWVQIGSDMITQLWQGIQTMFGRMAAWVKAELTKMFTIRNPFEGWFGGGPAAAQAVVDGTRAAGGPIAGGKTYLVGEEGPELITPSRSGHVNTAADTRRMSGAGFGGGIGSVSFGNIIIQGGANATPQQIGQEFGRQLREAFASIQADTEFGVV
ncbi:MAG TPA: phage tail tape measure protein [Devosia sp.]|nr:phage tail tape measure protein [Devosia sp.]